MTENPIIWQPEPEQLKKTAMYRFMKERSFDSYSDLYQWSIDNTADFWQALCDFCEVRFSKAAETVLVQPGDSSASDRVAVFIGGGKVRQRMPGP